MFERNLVQGKIGESEIARWLQRRGHHILPVYEIEKGQYKGPAVYTSNGESLIAPDLLAFGKGKITWIEAKHKTAFSWHRITQKWVTGIDLHHYFQYLKVMDIVDWPVWILFLHDGGTAKDSAQSESGLFGNSLEYLKDHENHRHKNHGKSGMVYWDRASLRKLSNFPLN